MTSSEKPGQGKHRDTFDDNKWEDYRKSEEYTTYGGTDDLMARNVEQHKNLRTGQSLKIGSNFIKNTLTGGRSLSMRFQILMVKDFVFLKMKLQNFVKIETS